MEFSSDPKFPYHWRTEIWARYPRRNSRNSLAGKRFVFQITMNSVQLKLMKLTQAAQEENKAKVKEEITEGKSRPTGNTQAKH